MQWFIVGSARDGDRAALSAIANELDSPVVAVRDLAALGADGRFLAASRPLVLVPSTGAAPDIDGLTAFVRDGAGHAFVVVLADTIAPEDYKRLVRTGGADWITWRDLETELRDLAARLAFGDAPGGAAKILCFVPSKGGVGNTTLAIETAIHLTSGRKRRSARVAILDLNLQGGTVADALDIEPRFDVAEIVDRPERLDEQLVDIFTSRHSPRLDVFASPLNRIDPATIKPETIFAFIDAIASRYDVVLFDMPPVWLPWTDALLGGSDAVVVSGGESVPALRRLSATLAHLDGLAIDPGKVAAVVNAADVDLLGRVARRTVIDRALGARRAFVLRRDGPNATAALDVGQPVLELAPNSRLGRDLRRLADWVDTKVDRPAAKRGAAPAAPRGAAA